MGIRTDIEWCDSTVNPTCGCDGCELWNKLRGMLNCYAGTLHERFGPPIYSDAFEHVEMRPGRMAKAAAWSDLKGESRPDKPWLDGLPRHIFVGDMGDILSRAVPYAYLDAELIEAANSTPGRRHVWMTLTKQAERFSKYVDHVVDLYGDWPDNIFPGVSVTTQRTLSRAEVLAETNLRYYISAEPLLERIDFGPAFEVARPALVILGGESGAGSKIRPCNLRWILDGVKQCREAGVKCFVKQAGSRPYVPEFNPNAPAYDDEWRFLKLKDKKGGDPSEWPVEIQVREFPR